MAFSFKIVSIKQQIKIIITLFAICICQITRSQIIIWQEEKLNTAKNASYMQPEEREMIYEINRLRSNPKLYATSFIKPQLDSALKAMQAYGKGEANYSITIITDPQNKMVRIDTTWHYLLEEEFHACQTLYDTLMNMQPLSILQPDEGIYKACIKHVKDQAPTNKLTHKGTDGSWPEERVKKFSPKMKEGNENIAYTSYSKATPRNIVLQLLIDAGIPEYGHRYNTLNAVWTHIACYYTKPPLMKSKWWLQEYGAIK